MTNKLKHMQRWHSLKLCCAVVFIMLIEVSYWLSQDSLTRFGSELQLLRWCESLSESGCRGKKPWWLDWKRHQCLISIWSCDTQLACRLAVVTFCNRLNSWHKTCTLFYTVTWWWHLHASYSHAHFSAFLFSFFSFWESNQFLLAFELQVAVAASPWARCSPRAALIFAARLRRNEHFQFVKHKKNLSFPRGQ